MTGSLVVLSFAAQSSSGAPRAAAMTVEGFFSSGNPQGPEQPLADVPEAREVVIATVGGLPLVNPAPDATVIGFHEAAGPGPVPLTPAWVMEDHNPGRPKPAPAGDGAEARGPQLLVLPSRGRPADATTAMDVAVPEGRPVVSPVSGTVLSVERYVLYGKHEDHIIRIAPDGRPDLAVKVVHIVGPQVAVGQEVEAGRTALAAGAKRFPFSSQIDRFTQQRGAGVGPHVHIEVEPAAG